MKLNPVAGLALVALVALVPRPADACTVFRLKAADGSVVMGRSMEFVKDLGFDLIVVPRNRTVSSPAPDGKAGATWKTRFGYVGVTQFGAELGVSEGMNEKGLVVSGLWFEADMKWQSVPPHARAQALAGPAVTDYLLGNLDSVAHVERELAKVRAFSFCAPGKPPFCPTMHFNACDARGACKVIEYEEGALHVYDNPLGIMTNAPRFPWHMTNLRQYDGLTNLSAPAREWAGVKLPATGHGSGMLGLPGDLSPPSRFVRLAFLTQYAYRQPDAARTLNLAQHIMNTFDIVLGMAIDPLPKGEKGRGKLPPSESTQWVTFSDLTNRVLDFRTYDNPDLRKVDLKKLDFAAPQVKRIRMFGTAQTFVDVSGAAR